MHEPGHWRGMILKSTQEAHEEYDDSFSELNVLGSFRGVRFICSNLGKNSSFTFLLTRSHFVYYINIGIVQGSLLARCA